MLASYNDRFESIEDQPVELIKINNETHTELFTSGSFFEKEGSLN